MDDDVQQEIDKLVATVSEATAMIKRARATIDKQNAEAERWQALTNKANALAAEAIESVAERTAFIRTLRERTLEQAVRYENEQLYYSHPDSRDHELCRIANERLNGVYAIMPALFEKSQRECIDLVRATAATAKAAE